MIIESPRNSDTPKMPSAARPATRRPRGPLPPTRTSSAISAMIPPSPSLSARMMSRTYLKVTITMIVQKTSDTTPNTATRSTGTVCAPRPLKIVCSV